MAKSAKILEIPATITERGQTTVPAAIRKMLALGKRDRVIFRGHADGTVVIAKKSEPADDDPVIGEFLAFLERDMAKEPSSIRRIDPRRVAHAAALVDGVRVDLDASLADDDA